MARINTKQKNLPLFSQDRVADVEGSELID